MEDAQQIQEIYNKHHYGMFGMPKLDFCISTVVVESENRIVGFGALERFLEGTIILDLSLPMRDKLKVVDNVIDSGIVAARLAGYDRFYVFPSPDKFADMLVKHFSFRECDKIYHLEVR
jgi:hypothetical protein